MIVGIADRLNQLKEYYFSVKLAEVRKLHEETGDVINMGVGSPDLPPSPNTIEALIETARNPDSHGYQPYKGITPLRNAMTNWYQSTYGVELDPEKNILPLMGSKEGITHISLAFLNATDQVLVPALGYPAYRAVTQMVGGKVREYPLDPETWHPDLDALASQDLSDVKLMWVNYPHMPSGSAATRSLFEKIVDFAREKQILIINDNPYSLILNEGDPLSLMAVPGAFECCLELNSMSKSHNMAGWRVGMVVGASDYLSTILKVKSNVDSGMFMGIQKAAVEAYKNLPQWHQDQNKIYRDRRNVVFKFLDRLECTYHKDQTGLFVWARVPDQLKSVEELVDHILYKYYLFITPGFVFGSPGDRFIRISLCNRKEVLQEALSRIDQFNYQEL